MFNSYPSVLSFDWGGGRGTGWMVIDHESWVCDSLYSTVSSVNTSLYLWVFISSYKDQISIKTKNPKCLLFSKKLTSKGTWRQVFICLRSPIPPPTLRYTHSHRERGGGRWTREKVRGALVHKRSRKYQHDYRQYLQSIKTIRHQ